MTSQNVLPSWLCMLLLLINHPFELPEPSKAVHRGLLAALAGEAEGNLLGGLLAPSEKWLHTTLETFLLPVVSPPTEGGLALFATASLCNLMHLMLLAELAIELLGLWMVHHFLKGRPQPS